MFTRRTFLVLIALVCSPPPAATQPQADAVDIGELVRRVDELYRAQSSYAVVEMSIQNPNWKRKLGLQLWSEGMEKTFIHITSPKREAGIATLRVGTEMWNYFPKINKVMKVPPSMMMGSWMGSDFTNDDIVKESTLTADYAASLAASESPEQYEIVLVPKQDTPTVWGRIKITVRKTDLIPLRQIYYDEDGTAMREMVFSDVQAFEGRRLPALLEMRPLNKEGHLTVIRYVDARFNIPPGSNTFSLRNLRKRR